MKQGFELIYERGSMVNWLTYIHQLPGSILVVSCNFEPSNIGKAMGWYYSTDTVFGVVQIQTSTMLAALSLTNILPYPEIQNLCSNIISASQDAADNRKGDPDVFK